MGKTNGDRLSDALDESIKARLDLVEVFSDVESTNSYLLEQPGPIPGHCRVALADHQTAGRGRMGRVWHSPRLSGLYLSAAYTFERVPRDFSSLTLAVGIAIAAGLKALGVSEVQLKWPNDLVVLNGKLGGILTELQSGKREATTVVVGIGLNLDLEGRLDAVATGIGRISDLRQVMTEPPDRLAVAAAIIEQLIPTLIRFEADGFAPFRAQWQRYDWLRGKAVRVVMPRGDVDGIASGVDDDGALLVQKGNVTERVVSGTVTLLPTDGDTQ